MLADKLGVSVRYVQAVEAGDENLTLDSLSHLAERLGLSLAALMRDAFSSDSGAEYQATVQKPRSSRAAEPEPSVRRRPRPRR